jgi:putative spermidine/putrescine transport system permease protein
MQQGPGGVRAVADVITRTHTAQPAEKTRGLSSRGWSYTISSWLGLVPFLLFCLLFELLPAAVIIQGSFTDSNTNAATLNNYQRMFSQIGNLHAFQTSVSISLVTALLGAIFGFLASLGVYNLRTGWLRNFLIGFSSIAANFAGVPLAFAFVATLGVTGFVTVAFHDWLHVSLYDLGFNLYTFGGLVLVYTYFQLPLMILVTVPALSALRPEWREAATNLGASSFTYWRRVALPILLPSLTAAAMLLFANSFGAYATAVALAQGAINIVPILIGFVVAGNVDIDTGLGNALAVGMIIVLLIAVSLYTTMLRRVNTWQGR